MEFKQVIVVRKDLRMGIGKIASQVGHAAVLGVERSRKLNKSWLRNWLNEGQPKIVVRVNSLDELLQVQSDAEKLMIPLVIIQDRGLTQIPTGTVTCIGIGPAPSDIIDEVTSELKLL
ncbi:MAG TPA: peptidyl-tRNA hydrolase Pth2 [Nitrososphaeraceae archaeon]|nr:peptidyl-tRNA hydrolase Pth2 [Nitrososphaeraceae archaeon]